MSCSLLVLQQFGTSRSVLRTLRFIFTTHLLALLVGTPALAVEQPDETLRVAPIDFDIPAQPLGRALVAFGAVAGLNLYYNAAFAEGRRSAAVSGKLTPVLALQELLHGTGLIPRMTGPNSVIVVPTTRGAGVSRGPAVASSSPSRYEPYFARLQARISNVLCRNVGEDQESDQAILRLWVTASGTVQQVEVMGGRAGQAGRHDLSAVVQGLAIGAPPPDMPQPVTLVVFPPSEARQDCRSSDAFQRAN